MIAVPGAAGMSAEIFRKHLEYRHIPAGDFADLKHFNPGSGFTADRSTFETYHSWLHKAWEYDHEHGMEEID